MNILRWLLCHLLSIILLISLVLIYSFRAELKDDFSSLLGSVAETETNEIKKSDVAPVASDKEYEKSVSAKSTAEAKVESRPAQAQKKIDDPWGAVLDGDEKQRDDTVRPTADTPLKSGFPPENYDPESSVTVENKGRATVKDEPGRAVPHAGDMGAENTATATENYFLALEEARRLYWEGKAGLAQAAYERLMFKYQDRPEAAAELGNLLLQQGNQKGATWAYKNAIPRYLNLHQEQEAISIMKLLSQYNPAIAKKLQKKYW
ncbi:MAG: hypothetical protein GXP23_08955 [Gammaproteobacteria bacterium]|nr:hypothetical protein [Gammaproteobacteria bacterium]